MIFILGGKGYVGSAYGRLFQKLGIGHAVIDRANYGDYVGKACDVLINANGNSKKFLADRDPKAEFDASVRSVVGALEDFKSGLYVQLSSGDVYPDTSRPALTGEDQVIDVRRQSRYGLHKYLAETLVQARHRRFLILRMGGFVGPGMKKNAIFDIVNDQTVWLKEDSELQFISTDAAARIVWDLCDQGLHNEIFNLGAKGVISIRDMHRRLSSRSVYSPEARAVRFELSIEKLAGHARIEVPSTASEVEHFFLSIGR